MAVTKKAPPSKSGTKSKKRAPCRTMSGKTQGKDQTTRERRQNRQKQTQQGKQQRQTRQQQTRQQQQRQTQTGKRSAPTSLEKELRGVHDVYLTPKSIAIRRVKTDKYGRIVSDKTQYFDRTNGNMKTLRREVGRVRVGRN